MFDEVYHAVTAKLIAKDDPRAYEWWNPDPEPNTAVDWLHPPLAKYTQAFFILAFGENALGWRFSSAVFGVLTIWMTALLAYELFSKHSLSLLAAIIAALDGLLLVQSRIAMNDIHVTFFILLAFLFYLKHLKHFHLFAKKKHSFRYLALTGISAGIAISSKWSGAFALGAIVFTEGVMFFASLIRSRAMLRRSAGQLSKKALAIFAALALVPAAIYFLSYSQMFIQGKDLAHFRGLHYQTWYYQTHLEATHAYQSRPIQWFLNLRPVWFAVDFSTLGKRADIYAFGNPVLFWLGAFSIVGSTAYLGVLIFKRNLEKLLKSKFLVLLLLFYFVVWIFWQFSPRIMFFYHYTPAVPLMSINLAYWLLKIKEYSKSRIGRLTPAIAVSIMAVAFIIWYPHWTFLSVPTSFADNIYFALKSWR